MMLRWVVANWLKQTARQQVMQAVAAAATGAGSSSDEPRPPHCDLLIAFALGIESGGLVDLLQHASYQQGPAFREHRGDLNGRDVVVLETGVGEQAASNACRDALQLHQPRWLISAGFAGALDARLQRGDILLADDVSDEQGAHWTPALTVPAAELARSRGLQAGRLLTVDRVVRTPAERTRLAEQHQAAACDMETAAIAAICQSTGTRWLSARIISDGVDDELPPGLEKLLAQKSWAGTLGAAAGAIFQRPSSVKDLWQLKEDALRASDRLAKFLANMVQQLPTG